MRRCALLGILVALVSVQTSAADAAPARKGPAGLSFYTPPSPLPAGKHGALIWSRALTGQAALDGAAKNQLVLYRSTSVDGSPTAVSGAVAVPKGKPPKGGWPVITWAHGTTGIADQCAPTRTAVLKDYDHPLLQRWLKAGYAVVRTDYEGLGTPGTHPYLIGVSEARSVLDIVLAARQLDPDLSNRVVIAGHSQGGHAALWAASLASKWTPSLNLRGTVAFAPASHLGDEAALLPALTSPSALSGLAALIIRGADAAAPSQNLASLLGPAATALYPQTLTACLPALEASTSFGAIAPAQLLVAGVSSQPLIGVLNANDPTALTIRTPVQIEQGTADTTVLPTFTTSLVHDYTARGHAPTYKTYAGLDHDAVVIQTKPQVDATAFIAKRLGKRAR